MTIKRGDEREILIGSAKFIWISASSTASIPVGLKWVTLAGMRLIVVIDTVVVDWPVVRVGGWQMGEREKGENPRQNLAEPACILTSDPFQLMKMEAFYVNVRMN